jgi:uncharacterized ferritin-like protein (DUF455 family)
VTRSPSARDWAHRVVASDRLADKLAPPPGDLEDDGPVLRLAAPGRPHELAIVPGRHAKVPPIAGMADPSQRVRILHALANHELQAIELFAWAYLAFPQAPPAFRRGLVAIAVDEQRHFALYADRLAAHDCRFGDHPITGHFWNKLEHFTSPLEFVCAMGLTFEAANLDLAGDYAAAARGCGDVATAAALDQVHADEIRHVHFGWTWLRRLAPELDSWDAYTRHVRFPLGPARARGTRLDRDARRRAGFDEAFIARLDDVIAKRPGGAPR